MGFWRSIGRGALAIGTGGASEVAGAAGFDPLGVGSGDGMDDLLSNAGFDFGARGEREDREAEAREAWRRQWKNIRDPGYYTPKEQAVDMPEAQRAGAYADEGMIDSQRRALAGLEDVYSHGGLTASDRARSRLAAEQTFGRLRGQREAGLQSAAMRGLGRGGAHLLASLSGQQAAGQALGLQDAAMLAGASDRALRAMEAAGGLSSKGREQSFSEEYGRRGALDEFALNMVEAERARRARNADRVAEGRRWHTEETRRTTEGQTGVSSHQADTAGEREKETKKNTLDLGKSAAGTPSTTPLPSAPVT